MSSNTYTMKLVVDDSAIRKLEARLGGVMGAGGMASSIGGIGGAGGQSGGGENPMKNLTKLGAIATGVGALVLIVKNILEKLVVASPALQAMLKILDTSFTLILRPFGDFVAFLLKPILILFLQKVALPFYQIFDSPLIKLGMKVGEDIAKKPGGAATGWGFGGALGAIGLVGLQLWIDEQGRKIKFWWLDTVAWFEEFEFPDLPTFDEIWQGLLTWFETLNIPTLDEIWQGLVGWFETLNIPTLDEIWQGLVGWFDTLNIPSLDEIWQGLVGWFDTLNIPSLDEIWIGLKSWFDTLNVPSLSEIWDGLVGWFDKLNIPTLEEIWDGVVAFFQDHLKIPDWLQKIIDDFFAFIDMIGDWLDSLPDFVKNMFGVNDKSNGRGENNDPNNIKKPQLIINIEGMINDAGRGMDNQKQQILSWFNEWMK